MTILDAYSQNTPSPQNILDIFEGEWSSKMPEGSGLEVSPGAAHLFEDGRVSWAIAEFGGVDGDRILELGPLEAGHTKMLHDAGASSILAVEQNSRAFLKCLCVKEIFGLDRANFAFGDCAKMLEDHDETYDICWASGILYHMKNPLGLLESISRVSDKMFLWTHYFDQEIASSSADAGRFSAPEPIHWQNEEFAYHRRQYGEATDWKGFCGGGQEYANWLTRADLLKALDLLGFGNLEIAHETREHPHGPCLSICARKSVE